MIKINLETLKLQEDIGSIVDYIADKLTDMLNLPKRTIDSLERFENLLKKESLPRPLILILDEFDALTPEAISGMASVFRNIYNLRFDEQDKPAEEKTYLLHGVALIGVRAVLGIENRSGSPFNVQRSLHIPNLTFAEVESMFKWYEEESG